MLNGKRMLLFASMALVSVSGSALAQQAVKPVVFEHNHSATVASSAATPAQQTTKPVILTANVTFQQEQLANPAVTGGTGLGSAVLVLSADRTKVDYSVVFTGLSSAVRVAHIHSPGGFGTNGGVKRDICGTGTTPACAEGTLYHGTWATTDMTQALTEAQITELLTGLAYVNVHTANNGGGEIRGQVTPISPK